jgi:phenylacetic acid degradation operon negative regulatory protein
MRQAEAVSLQRAAPGARRDVARWIARALAADPPRANSLIVTVWGDALAPHGGEAWLGTIIRLLAPFGINERAVRTSVFRLARDGWLEAESFGRQSRYRLTAEGARRFEQAHQRIYSPTDPRWDGDWELVLAPPERLAADLRARFRDELRWEGFGVFAPGVWGRPAHGASAAPRIAVALGIADRVTAVRARDDAALGGHPLAACLGEAWDLATLAAGYRRFLTRFGSVAHVWRTMPPDDAQQAFVVRTLLIHAFRRVLLRDPQLPAALLPADWPGERAFALTRDLYRIVLPRAERHLAATADELRGSVPDSFGTRFGERPR